MQSSLNSNSVAVARGLRALSALSFAAIIASCSYPSYQSKSVSAHPKSRLQAHRSTVVSVVRQPAPDCELAGLEPDTVDMDLWARLKLDFKRHCDEQALRRRPRLLGVTQPPPPVDVTGSTVDQPVPSAVTPAPASSVAETAKSYHERAIAEYRNGDFVEALIDCDLAIRRDPNFEDAYINRGIILYRLHQLNPAFDDVAHALRIERSHRIEHP
jgi:tetratricopeptide (TPR) repeat protein